MGIKTPRAYEEILLDKFRPFVEQTIENIKASSRRRTPRDPADVCSALLHPTRRGYDAKVRRVKRLTFEKWVEHVDFSDEYWQRLQDIVVDSLVADRTTPVRFLDTAHEQATRASTSSWTAMPRPSRFVMDSSESEADVVALPTINGPPSGTTLRRSRSLRRVGRLQRSEDGALSTSTSRNRLIHSEPDLQGVFIPPIDTNTSEVDGLLSYYRQAVHSLGQSATAASPQLLPSLEEMFPQYPLSVSRRAATAAAATAGGGGGGGGGGAISNSSSLSQVYANPASTESQASSHDHTYSPWAALARNDEGNDDDDDEQAVFNASVVDSDLSVKVQLLNVTLDSYKCQVRRIRDSTSSDHGREFVTGLERVMAQISSLVDAMETVRGLRRRWVGSSHAAARGHPARRRTAVEEEEEEEEEGGRERVGAVSRLPTSTPRHRLNPYLNAGTNTNRSYGSNVSLPTFTGGSHDDVASNDPGPTPQEASSSSSSSSRAIQNDDPPPLPPHPTSPNAHPWRSTTDSSNHSRSVLDQPSAEFEEYTAMARSQFRRDRDRDWDRAEEEEVGEGEGEGVEYLRSSRRRRRRRWETTLSSNSSSRESSSSSSSSSSSAGRDQGQGEDSE